jgi:hypothetical protein
MEEAMVDSRAILFLLAAAAALALLEAMQHQTLLQALVAVAAPHPFRAVPLTTRVAVVVA